MDHSGTPFAPIFGLFSSGGNDFSFEQQGGGWYWAGGAPSASSTSATQALVIPVNATTLTFNVWEGFCVPDNGAGDFVSVTIDGTEVFNSGVCTTEAFYAQAPVIDLATAPGGPYNDGFAHTIAILGTMDFTAGDPQTGSIWVDNLGINVPLANPIPPTPSMCTAVICGDGAFPQFSAAGTEECDDGNTAGGDGCSASCTVEQPNFICEDPEPAAASGDDLADGGLEDGSPNLNWLETGTQFDPICSQVFCGAALANDGAFYAWFGGSSMPNDQTLTQNVTISPTATDLTFDLLVGICDSAADNLTVDLGGTEIYRYDCTSDTGAYQPQTAPIPAGMIGTTQTLTFIGHTEAVNAGNSNFFVDNISIQDNVAFAGVPGSCFELPTACNTIEQFEAGIPAGWTVVNLGPDAADGWGTTDDGICGTENWSGGNVTGGSGEAACADSDATGQIDGGASLANEMDTYLCTPAMDLTLVTDPQLSFLVNYQAADNDLNDNGTPENPLDDFDEDFLQVLIGEQAPNALTVGGYTNLGNVFDHLDTTLALSEEAALNAGLTAQNASTEAYVCFHYRGTYAWFAQIDNAGLRGSACAAPPDGDNDGVPDTMDNCPADANPGQENNDGDSAGDVCDDDDDNDTVEDTLDNCPLDANTDQADNDLDNIGDVCDPDDDNDTVLDGVDNCPIDANTDQADNDLDNIGDVCDPDDDNDTVLDGADNCPIDANTDQADNDLDNIGDVCDPDDDNDTVLDGADNCPIDANADQADNDLDNIGDVCDPDDDNDTVLDGADNCPIDANADQADNDVDNIGDVCDPDDDNDTVLDGVDNCPIDANTDQADNDLDNIGDVCDPDDDNDTVLDGVDNCPLDANPNQEDFDMDGEGDACDDDVDGDNVVNDNDVCPATVIPEGVPTLRFKKNRYALTGIPSNSIFQTTSKKQFTTEDTGGCSCEQIIAALGLGMGHTRHGCSRSAMQQWSNTVN